MLIGNLLRFSSNKDEIQDKDNDNSEIDDDLMPKSLSKKVTSFNDHKKGHKVDFDLKHISLDDLSEVTRSMLMDKNLEVSKVRPFFWTMVETYVDRFQVFPFDAIKALFSYLEMQEYPEEQLRDLVKQLEDLYQKQHGGVMHESKQMPVTDDTLEDEINELRETLKYAAIVGERIDGDK